MRPHGLLAHQAPLSMGFSRQEHWSSLLFLYPGQLSMVLSKQALWDRTTMVMIQEAGLKDAVLKSLWPASSMADGGSIWRCWGKGELQTKYRNLPPKFQSLLFPSKVPYSGAPISSCNPLNLLLQTTCPLITRPQSTPGDVRLASHSVFVLPRLRAILGTQQVFNNC